ncbi:MAG: hypothetical protein EBT79_02450 [Actinobacteria bacterium]|nr:hypothetical protein [Actinomycetota bacterium]
MAYWPETRILSANSPSTDAFARWRVSVPQTLFDTINEYDTASVFWSTETLNGGSVTHLPNESSVQLSVPGVLNARVIRQTYEYYKYQPGKSQLVVLTAVFGADTAGVRRRIGYFDSKNGIFFEQTAAGLRVVRRTYTSGGVVDDPIDRASWNVDPLDGSGPSGMNLDPTKANIYWFDIEWLGVGRVRMGVWGPDGQPVVCHVFENANAFTTVYMTTANLPIRYEIENTAGGSAATLKQICSTVMTEGESGTIAKPYYFGATATSNLAVTTRQAVFSIRPRTTFQGLTNRIRVVPQDIGMIVTTNDALWELVYNPTFTGAPAWSDANTANSSVEYSTHTGAGNGAITGGIVVATGFAPAAQGSFAKYEAKGFDFKYPITLDLNGANPIALSIVCTSLNNTANIRSLMNWAEVR